MTSSAALPAPDRATAAAADCDHGALRVDAGAAGDLRRADQLRAHFHALLLWPVVSVLWC
jgi:hypothetical protein